MRGIFKDILKGKVVIVGIGNIMRGDDGFGPALIEELSGRIDAVCIDAGVTPENHTGIITKEKPDTILLVDAVHLDLTPGEYTLLKKDDILNSALTTHNMSPAMLINFLESGTKADMYLLGIQPGAALFGDEMSASVKKTLTILSESIKKELENNA